MDNYTVTFKYDNAFDLPNKPEERDRKAPAMVLELLEQKKFELVDFNFTQNYNDDNVKHYIKDECLHRAVVEIKLCLTMDDLSSRDEIYNRCLEALKQKRLELKYAYENEDKSRDILQSIIVFSEKSQQKASA